MSAALPGNHYCAAHQGNYSHYATHNCELCDALASKNILGEMLTWAYSKLHSREFSKLDDALELDRLKLYVEHGVLS